VTHIPESVPGLTSAAIIRIYPNPATHTVYIHAAIPVSVRLSTIEGKTVAQQIIPGGVRTAFDLSDLATGVYLLNIADESGRLIRVEKLVRTAE